MFSRIPAHGTAMLSLAAGNTLGVAKKVSPVLVRMPRRNPLGRGFTQEDFLDGLGQIFDDMTITGSQVSAIVLLSLAYPKEEFNRRNSVGDWLRDDNGNLIDDSFGWSTRCKALLKGIAEKGGLVVTGAGNQDGNIIMWPAMFAKAGEADPISSLLVVGGVSTDGQSLTYTYPLDNGIPHVYAPGSGPGLRAANGQPVAISNGNTYKDSSGTSDGESSFDCRRKLPAY